jgi:hypothetical protein
MVIFPPIDGCIVLRRTPKDGPSSDAIGVAEPERFRPAPLAFAMP